MRKEASKVGREALWGLTSVDFADTHAEVFEMKSDFIQIVKELYPYEGIWKPIQWKWVKHQQGGKEGGGLQQKDIELPT